MFGLTKVRMLFNISCILLISFCSKPSGEWVPNTDWGHWRLGHRSDHEFLRKNRFTVTFGSGAPNFENVSREAFDQRMEEAKAFNQAYHDSGYIVLRYLSTSLNGNSQSNKDTPKKEQIHMLDFYNDRWENFEDYIGPKPPEDPTEWITIRPDGTFPFYRYAPYGRETDEGFETWGCPNNPYYVQMMEGRIRAQAETGIDGSYVDWTHIAGGTCYCKHCREAFKSYLKEHLPEEAAKAKYGTSDYANVEPPKERGEPFWMEWIMFRCQTVADFHDRLRTVARKYNPHFMISGNVFGGFGYGPIAYDAAGNVELLGDVDDFVYSEIQEFLDSAPRKDEDGTKITNSPALKFLAAATHGKPVIEYATEITPPIFPDPTEKCLSAMAQINIAEAAANHAVFREKRQTPPGATRIHRFLAENEASLVGAHLHASVAVLASLTPYFADELSFAFSMSRVLADEGVSHMYVLEQDVIDKKLGAYDILIVPYMPLLDRRIQNGLLWYAERGGTLLILGECGVKDRHDVPMEHVPLAAVFQGERYPTVQGKVSVGKGKVVFHPLPIPESRFLIRMKAKGEYTTFGPTMAHVFADIPEGYTRNRMDSKLRQVLEKVAEKTIALSEGRVSRLVDAPPYVEMTTMMHSTQDRLLVHLVNYDVTVDGTITPAGKIKVEAVLPHGAMVKSLSYSGILSEMKPVRFTLADRLLSFELDRLDVYGLAVIELK